MMGLLRYRMRYTTFLTYHQADQAEVRAFADYFDHTRDVFLDCGDALARDTALHHSRDSAASIRRIRSRYLADSLVTLVLIGGCTWASHLVDWQIQASLSPYEEADPNALLGIVLPSAGENLRLPMRLQMNLGSGYARVFPHTWSIGKLAEYVHAAFELRSRMDLLVNPQERMAEDAPCS